MISSAITTSGVGQGSGQRDPLPLAARRSARKYQSQLRSEPDQLQQPAHLDATTYAAGTGHGFGDASPAPSSGGERGVRILEHHLRPGGGGPPGATGTPSSTIYPPASGADRAARARSISRSRTSGGPRFPRPGRSGSRRPPRSTPRRRLPKCTATSTKRARACPSRFWNDTTSRWLPEHDPSGPAAARRMPTQANRRPCPSVFSGGSSTRHRSEANGHRGANARPAAGRPERAPGGMTISGCSTGVCRSGTTPTRARV